MLNRNNDGYYRDYLVPLAEQLPVHGFPASTHAMRRGFVWFERSLREMDTRASASHHGGISYPSGSSQRGGNKPQTTGPHLLVAFR